VPYLQATFSVVSLQVKKAAKLLRVQGQEKRNGLSKMSEFMMNNKYEGDAGGTERDDIDMSLSPHATTFYTKEDQETIDQTSSHSPHPPPNSSSSSVPLIPSDGDLMLLCKDCHYQFIFTMGEQEFYNLKGFSGQPTRCKPCRAQKKLSRDQNNNHNSGHHHHSQANFPMGATMGAYVMLDPYGVPYYPYPTHQPNPSVKLCHAFMRGECMYGNECRYSHDTASAYAPYNGYAAYAPIPPHSFPNDPNYQSNYHSQQPSRRLHKSKNPCFAYHRGGCTYGDTCRYTHDDNVTLPADFQFPPSQSQARKHFCHAFQRGECTYGDTCRFIHEEQQQPQPQQFPSNSSPPTVPSPSS
jgi:hypothetical protein